MILVHNYHKANLSDDPSTLPKISIVTPCYNHVDFIEATIHSVIRQGYPNLEYAVIDGGSTDGTVEIIARNANNLTYWCSRPDDGQYNAINHGFQHTTGEIMGWLNSSDMYCPWTLMVVAQVFQQNPQIEWVTTIYPLRWDEHGLAVSCRTFRGYSKEAFYDGRYGGAGKPGWQFQYIQQESTFWRRSLWEKAGSKIDEHYTLAADFDLWARFYEHAELYGLPVPLGGNRIHEDQRSSQAKAYQEQCREILSRYEPGLRSHIRTLAVRIGIPKVPRVRAFFGRKIGYQFHYIIRKRNGAWVSEKAWMLI